ncbi:MAG: S8 family serine peptidase [Bacteroidota bacterium]
MRKRQTVFRPNSYSYFNKLQNEIIELNPDDSEVVVTFQPDESDLEVFSLQKFRVIASDNNFNDKAKVNESLGVAVYKKNSNSDVADIVELTNEYPETANSLPALRDKEGNTRYFIPDELTVQFQEGLDDSRMEDIINDINSEIVMKQRTPGYYTISVPENSSLFETIDMLNRMDEVVFSEPSEIGFNDDLIEPPRDSDFKKLWGLYNTGQSIKGTSGKPGVDIDVLNAWNVTQGDKSVITAVIDTGMDLFHPDLNPNLLPRNGEDWDFADSDGSPDDKGSHGTHVCGTVSAVMNNNLGIVGVAPACSLMPLRINLRAGRNQNRADAINYVANQAQKNPNNRYVVNCSWRASGNFSAIGYAISRAVTKNVLIVFAAGNAKRDMDSFPQYPAVYPDVIAVAALDSKNRKAGFSNYGSQVDVSAPGVNIWSTIPSNSYNYKNGTSMAAPHVAGVAALIWSANKSLSAKEVRSILESTCENVSSDNPKYPNKLGKGRINAFNAVKKAVS